MSREIEHKYLVKGDYKTLSTSAAHIVQGYLAANGHGATIRIRIRDEKAFLTIKGPSSSDGLERSEFEYPIPEADAREMLKLCSAGRIEKLRHLVPWKGHTVEVDEFLDENAGLVVAEIEVGSADEPIELPPFIGREVTGDPRFYNSQLSKHPFSKWDRAEKETVLNLTK